MVANTSKTAFLVDPGGGQHLEKGAKTFGAKISAPKFWAARRPQSVERPRRKSANFAAEISGDKTFGIPPAELQAWIPLRHPLRPTVLVQCIPPAKLQAGIPLCNPPRHIVRLSRRPSSKNTFLAAILCAK